MSLLGAYNLPFAAALVALLLISLAQILGLGEMLDGGDADAAGNPEPGVDPAGADGALSSGFVDGAMSLLGLGRVPLLIWLMLLLFVFSAIGVSGQALATALIGAPLDPLLAALLASVAALPLNGALIRPLAALLPKDETSAVGLDSLVRRDAEIQIGTARQGSPARALVRDHFGHPHFVMVEPHDPDAALESGEQVLLVRRDGEVFFAVRYESPLLSVGP